MPKNWRKPTRQADRSAARGRAAAAANPHRRRPAAGDRRRRFGRRGITIATTALDSVGPSSTAAPQRSPAGAQPLTHRVARGETAFTIARAYNVRPRRWPTGTSLGADMAVREGQTLIIPIATAPAPDPEPLPTPPGAGSPTPEPPSAKKPLPGRGHPAASETAKATPPSPDLGEAATGASAAAFAMPVQGKIIRGYDKKKNQGIDIAAPAGTTVGAASAGTVAAVVKDTDQVPIVMIRHDGGPAYGLCRP
jgi:hypothetical protein